MADKKSQKILFLVQLPPPIHGSSVINKSIKDSKIINSHFETRYVDISPAKNMTDIGKFSLSKVSLTFRIFFRAISAYIKFKPNLVYLTLSPHGLAFYKDSFLSLVLKALGAKMVFHMHGKGIVSSASKSFLKRNFYQAVFRRVSVITLSPLLNSDIFGIADMRMPINSVANGINSQKLKKDSVQSDIVVFGFLSNFVPSKGLETIIHAATDLHREGYTNIECKFIGGFRSLDYEDHIRKMVAESPDVRFCFTGPLFGEEKIKELSNGDVFVYPTENDCFPLVVLEAMSLGLPVIASDQGALPEIIDHGITGEILKSNSPSELAAVMKKFIDDKNYRLELGANGKEKFLKKYTQEKFEKNLINALKEIVLTKPVIK